MGNLVTETPYSEVTATMELLDRLGVGREDLKRFRKSTSGVKAEVAKLIKGNATSGHIIDCDADPFVPDGWKVEEHKKGGQLSFDPAQVQFHLVDGQKGSKSIEGNKIRKELSNMPVMNANVLDFLLDNPDLIPEDWKTDEGGNTLYIFFWGTVYCGSDVGFHVRYLCWRHGRWGWGAGWLDGGWGGSGPALVRAP